MPSSLEWGHGVPAVGMLADFSITLNGVLLQWGHDVSAVGIGHIVGEFSLKVKL